MKKYFSLFLLLLFGVNVWAHPHAFIDMKNRILVKDNQLQGFSVQWTLDDVSASAVLYDLAQLKDNPKATQKLIDEMMANIVSEHYFSYIYDAKNTKIKYKAEPLNYGINTQNQTITYYFDFLLSKPQDLKNNQFTLFTYDPSYYIAMEYQGNNRVDFSALPKNCQGKLIQPNIDEKVKNYANSLDQFSTPEDQTLGKQFSQKVEILCQ